MSFIKKTAIKVATNIVGSKVELITTPLVEKGTGKAFDKINNNVTAKDEKNFEENIPGAFQYIGKPEGFFDNKNNIEYPIELEDDTYKILEYVDGEWTEFGKVETNKKLLRKTKEYKIILRGSHIGTFINKDGSKELDFGKLRIEDVKLGRHYQIIEGKKKVKADIQHHIGDFQDYITIYDEEYILSILMICLARRLDLYETLLR